MTQEYLTNSFTQTKKLGEKLAKEILNFPLKKKAVALALIGELGGGKTTFLQGFARGLGVKGKILSPTFVIMKKFQVSSSKFQLFYHIDCYRIQKPKEILTLGFKDIISNPKNIVAIEWADRARKILAKNTIWIKFRFLNRNKREIIIKAGYKLPFLAKKLNRGFQRGKMKQ